MEHKVSGQFYSGRRVNLAITIWYVLVMFLTATSGSLLSEAQAQTPQPKYNYAQKAFESVWQRTDLPVASQRTGRSWYWGPEPSTPGLYEPYLESPYGRRMVQYFDKTRMEINDPTRGTVTNGLLVVELITGRVQQGDNTFDERLTAGANIAVAGDPINTFPTYTQLAAVYNRPDPAFIGAKVGEPVVRMWYGAGRSSTNYYRHKDEPASFVAVTENGFGIPAAFWEFVNRRGMVYNNGRYGEDLISDWRFSVGLPVTEAFWTQIQVGGVEKDVLFQAFERRILTFTPSNVPEYQVEMGNVGQHYLQWRYKGSVPQNNNPLVNLFATPVQQSWYQATEVLNVRTAPDTNSANPSYSQMRPFFQRMQKGDRIKPIRAVRGEEVEPGNDVWFQIYEKPDLFVYSKYLEEIKLPDFPKPRRTYNGLWVAVSLNKQMLAVFNGQTQIFSTLVATGRKEVDPETNGIRDYSTITGSFAAIGGWRPLTQTMEGGNRASGDFYKLEDVRYVTYFYQDFAIHGSYWHAKYGLVPQSRGCVNATVYDASLIHQLPVGTPVEVFL
jgi:hypothetical protein